MSKYRNLALRFALLAAATLMLGLLSSCVMENVGEDGGKCNKNGVCAEGLVCCDGICKPSCPGGDGDTGDGDRDVDPEIEWEFPVEEEIEAEEGEEDAEYPVLPHFYDEYGGGVCSESMVCWELPWPSGYGLNALWYNGADTIWVAGNNGALLNFDREFLDGRIKKSTPDLIDIDGSSDDDLWAVGKNATVLYYDGNDDLEWVPYGPNDIGGGERDEPLVGDDITFRAVYAESENSVYIMGDEGNLWHYDGSDWSEIDLEIEDTTIGFNAMWGAPGELYVIVADKGLIYTATTSPTVKDDFTETDIGDDDIKDVWGLSASQVFAVGDNNTIYYYGEAASATGWYDFGPAAPEAREEAQSNFTAIAGSETETYVVGESGEMLRLAPDTNPNYEGSEEVPDFIKNHTWEKVDIPATDVDLSDIIVTDMTEIFITASDGGMWATSLVYFEEIGGEWKNIYKPTAFREVGDTGEVTAFDVTALGGMRGGDRIYAGLSNGAAYYLDLNDIDVGTDGDADTGEADTLEGEANEGDKEESDGEEAEVKKGWLQIDADLVPSGEDPPQEIRDIVVNTDGYIYFVGEKQVTRWTEGASAETVADGALLDRDTDLALESGWAIGDGDIVVVGGEHILFYDADQEAEPPDPAWSVIQDEPFKNWDDESDNTDTHSWSGVWGDNEWAVWIVGNDGEVALRTPVDRYNRDSGYYWRIKALDPTITIHDVWGDDEESVWFAGSGGKVWHYQGESDGPQPFPVSGAGDETFNRLSGLNERNVFAIGDQGSLWHFSKTGQAIKLHTGYEGSGKRFVSLFSPFMDEYMELQVYLGGMEGDLLKASIAEEDLELEEYEQEAEGEGDADPVTDGDLDQDEDIEEEIIEQEPEPELEPEPEPEPEPELEPEPEQEIGWALSCLAPEQGQVCSSDCLCWSHPLIQGNKLNDFFATSDDDVWAAGNDGALLSFDGASWTQELLGGDDIIGVAKRAENEVYFITADAVYVFTGDSIGLELSAYLTAYRDIDIDEEGNIYVLETGTSDDSVYIDVKKDLPDRSFGWSSINVDTDVVTGEITSMWVKNSSKLYLAGLNVYKYDATGDSSWIGARPSASLYVGIYGFSDTQDLIVLTGSNYFYHSANDGETWSPVVPGSTADIMDVWGASMDDLYAVGKEPGESGDGFVSYKGDSGWAVDSGMSLMGDTYTRVYGSSTSQVFLSSENGGFWTGSQGDWTDRFENKIQSETYTLDWVRAVGASNIWAGGEGVLLHNDGSGWADQTGAVTTELGIPDTTNFISAWVDGDGRLYVTTDQTAIAICESNNWSKVEDASMANADTIVGFAADSIYYGANPPYYYNGSSAAALSYDGGNASINELWGSSDTLYAAGDDGLLSLSATENEFSLVAGAGATEKKVVAGTGNDGIYLAGTPGDTLTVQAFNGSTWSDITGTLPTDLVPADLFSVDGALFMVTDGAAGSKLFVYHNAYWNELEQAPEGVCNSHGQGLEAVFIVGANGAILEYRAQSEID